MSNLLKGLGLVLTALAVGGWLSTGPADLDPVLLRKAEQEYALRKSQVANQRYITLVDYRKNILQKRLWVFDRRDRRVVLNARVSHALNSGLLYPTSFSNTEGTEKSSPGTFITLNPYQGKFGNSLRIKGVTKGVNTNAMKRAIVFHPGITYRGLTYSGPTYSLGCFVTNDKTNQQLIRLIKGGTLVYVHP